MAGAPEGANPSAAEVVSKALNAVAGSPFQGQASIAPPFMAARHIA
jgi:hypothetical protein